MQVGALHKDQRNRFASDGYLLIRDAIPAKLLADIDTEIDATIAHDPPPVTKTGKHFYFHSPDRLPASDQALRASGALDLAEQLTSPHALVHGYGHIQVALNIPRWDHVPGGPHLDGYHDPERPHPFTLLAGIFLGDETEPGSGNIWVWPGSHLHHAHLFRSRGGRALMETTGHTLSLDDPPDLGDPIPVLANRGDLLLAHYLLGHNTGGNTGTTTRRAVYYRLSTPLANAEWEGCMSDAYREFPSIRPR